MSSEALAIITGAQQRRDLWRTIAVLSPDGRGFRRLRRTPVNRAARLVLTGMEWLA